MTYNSIKSLKKQHLNLWNTLLPLITPITQFNTNNTIERNTIPATYLSYNIFTLAIQLFHLEISVTG